MLPRGRRRVGVWDSSLILLHRHVNNDHGPMDIYMYILLASLMPS